MRQSELFTKTIKEAPKDEKAKNAELLLRAGFISKEMAGVYTFLPLGLRVIRKVEKIIRKEMSLLGASEILMPALHPLENYQKTGRDTVDVLFFTSLVNKKKLLLGMSHEEIITPLVKNYILSYKDLPFSTYQIQTKFRNELRAKSGILRGREFVMKDLYSFHKNENDLNEFYEKVKESYQKIFNEIGISDKTYLTLASGGTFSDYSHEFQTITKSGEDLIYLCPECSVAINQEIIDSEKSCPVCKKDKSFLIQKKAIEIANIFKLKTKFSQPFELFYPDEAGKPNIVFMGCYGIGITRLIGTVVEANSDENGIIWPESIAPYKYHLISLGKTTKNKADEIYKKINENDDVLYDDRDEMAGKKFAESDLIGIPYRIIISEKTLEKNSVEIKKRDKKDAELIKIDNLQSYV